jgi:hypothetical protein
VLRRTTWTPELAVSFRCRIERFTSHPPAAPSTRLSSRNLTPPSLLPFKKKPLNTSQKNTRFVLATHTMARPSPLPLRKRGAPRISVFERIFERLGEFRVLPLVGCVLADDIPVCCVCACVRASSLCAFQRSSCQGVCERMCICAAFSLFFATSPL